MLPSEALAAADLHGRHGRTAATRCSSWTPRSRPPARAAASRSASECAFLVPRRRLRVRVHERRRRLLHPPDRRDPQGEGRRRDGAASRSQAARRRRASVAARQRAASCPRSSPTSSCGQRAARDSSDNDQTVDRGYGHASRSHHLPARGRRGCSSVAPGASAAGQGPRRPRSPASRPMRISVGGTLTITGRALQAAAPSATRSSSARRRPHRVRQAAPRDTREARAARAGRGGAPAHGREQPPAARRASSCACSPASSASSRRGACRRS